MDNVAVTQRPLSYLTMKKKADVNSSNVTELGDVVVGTREGRGKLGQESKRYIISILAI